MPQTLEATTPTLANFASDFSKTVIGLWPKDQPKDGGNLSFGNPSRSKRITASIEKHLATKKTALSSDVWSNLLSMVIGQAKGAMLRRPRTYSDIPEQSTEQFRRGLILGAVIAESLSPYTFTDISDDPIVQTLQFARTNPVDLDDLGVKTRLGDFSNTPELGTLGGDVGRKHALAVQAGIILVLHSVDLGFPTSV